MNEPNGNKPEVKGSKFAAGLVHWPVVDKIGDIVCTNVTNLDIHDIARACRVYDLDRYYIVNKQKSQLSFVHRVLDHWRVGEGAHYNSMRRTALTMIETAVTLQDALTDFKTMAGDVPVRVVGTSAKPQAQEKGVTFRELRESMARGREAYFLVFGTGYGLAPEIEELVDVWLEPIKGRGEEDYRHLSVRSAASICLDRLLGAW